MLEGVLICTGSGGVGKTTLSASMGAAAAEKGSRVLVLTIDPARRLARALGIDSTDDIVRVPEQKFSGELYAGKIDSEKIFESFIRQASPNEVSAQKILSNKLYKQLATTLSGSQEFTALIALLTAWESQKYDLVILDTPPAQHAMDFLSAPEKIYTLFQGQITQWFIGLQDSSNQSLFKKIVHSGTLAVLGALKMVTGGEFIEELSNFFLGLSELQKNISDKCLRVQSLLKASQTQFALATSFDRAKIEEARRYFKDLQTDKYNLKTVIINRAFPEWVELVDPDHVDEVPQLMRQQYEYYMGRSLCYNDLANEYKSQLRVLQLTEMDGDLSGLSGLAKVANQIELKWNQEETQ